MEQPSETQGKDWLKLPSTYTAVEIQLDLRNSGCWKTTLFPLGLLKFQTICGPQVITFLLSRCAYRENGPARTPGSSAGTDCAVPFLPENGTTSSKKR